MLLTRLPDWRRRLSAAHEAARRTPFSWAEHHCGLFVAGCVLAMTGVDLAAGFRDLRPASAEDAQAALVAAGHADICSFAAACLPEIAPARARIGDVAAMPVPGPVGWSLGIVIGERVTVCRPDGLGTVSRLDARRAFAVGGGGVG